MENLNQPATILSMVCLFAITVLSVKFYYCHASSKRKSEANEQKLAEIQKEQSEVRRLVEQQI